MTTHGVSTYYLGMYKPYNHNIILIKPTQIEELIIHIQRRKTLNEDFTYKRYI